MSSGILKRFPFTAISGMDDVKTALKCAVINDELKGVLIKGPTGTAKSLLVRSFVDILPDVKIVNVPPNVTDEQLFGGMDLEHAITNGRTVTKEGLLKRAHNNILYLDNINLFDPKTLNSVMDCVESGRVVIERDGISDEYECETTVIATMDPAEGSLTSHQLDRFDICVQTRSSRNAQVIQSMIELNLERDADPDGFAKLYETSDKEIASSIATARSKLNNVSVTCADLNKISQVCMDLNVTGIRGDISTARVAKTLAALDGMKKISDVNVKDAAVLCLLHRRIVILTEEMPEEETATVNENTVVVPEEELPVESLETYESSEYSGGRGDGIGKQNFVSEITEAVKSELEDMDKIETARLHEIIGSSKRKDITTKDRSGRYRSSRIPDDKSRDPAFDATVKAAAPFQTVRDKKGLSIAIEPRDIRDKVRVKRDSCSFLFAVDVSGSLVKSGRMQDIKDGVKAMLMEGYVHRDKIALMTFKYDDIHISVPFTRSLEHVYDVLDDTMTGGCTPLGEALLVIREYLLNYIRKNKEERCYVILITDGDANEPVIKGNIASVELKKIAATMNIPNTEWIVVDSGLFANGVSNALRLAHLLNGRYIRLEDLSAA